MTTDTTNTTTPELGETVQVLAGLAAHYGRPLAKVIRLNELTATIALYYDGTEHRIAYRDLDLIDRRLGVTEVAASLREVAASLEEVADSIEELNSTLDELELEDEPADIVAASIAAALEHHLGAVDGNLPGYTHTITPAPTGEELLVVISCGKAKADTTKPAAELYTGGYFTSMLRAARALTSDANIRILSAAHGLLELDAEVAPYNVTLGDEQAIDEVELALYIARDATTYTDRPVVALMGRRYADLLEGAYRRAGVTTELVRPLAGVRGIGEAKALLRLIAEAGTLDLDVNAGTVLPDVVEDLGSEGLELTNAAILDRLELGAVVVDSSGYAYEKTHAGIWRLLEDGEAGTAVSLADLGDELIEVNGEPLPPYAERVAIIAAANTNDERDLDEDA